MALVSVIVPAFNCASFLATALDSALAQTHADLELIIVDDGSTDETPAIAQEFARRDSRVQVVRQDNAGVGAARNSGIARARGEYIAPLDADDVWHPEKIAAQVAAMEAGGARIGFVYCWCSVVNVSGAVLRHSQQCVVSGDVLRPLIFRNFLHSASVPLFRTAAVRAVGAYTTRVMQSGAQGCEDWDLALRVAERYQAAVVPRYLVNYREVLSGMSFGAAEMMRSFVCMHAQVRQRHPELPERLFRWATGVFCLYLAGKCLAAGDNRATRRFLTRAVRADPAVLLLRSFFRKLISSVLRQTFPQTFPRPHARRVSQPLQLTRRFPPLTLPARSTFVRIDRLRWSSLLRKEPR